MSATVSSLLTLFLSPSTDTSLRPPYGVFFLKSCHCPRVSLLLLLGLHSAVAAQFNKSAFTVCGNNGPCNYFTRRMLPPLWGISINPNSCLPLGERCCLVCALLLDITTRLTPISIYLFSNSISNFHCRSLIFTALVFLKN